MVFGLGGKRRMAGDTFRQSIDLNGGADPYDLYGAARGVSDLSLYPSTPVAARPAPSGSVDLGGLAETVASAAPLGQRFSEGAGQFLAKNGKWIGRGGLGLGALGLAASAAGELGNPNESKLNNLAGAAGTVAGGGLGLAGGAAIGAGVAGALSGPLAPLAMPIGAAIGSTVLGSAGNAISRGVASLWEDPAAKALRQQVALRDAERSARIKDLEAMLPYEYEAAEMKAALQQRIAAQQAELQNQQLLQQGLVQSMADRTRGQQAWDNTLAAGIMNTLVG